MNTLLPPLCVIAGPTATGKSALAVALAQRTNGVIVNADSAQVYADLKILSARPADAEMGGVEHRLFGTRDGAKPCSAADWAIEAKAVVRDVHSRGRLPILVGGTGLYLRTLLDGIAEVPATSPEIRAQVRASETSKNHRRLAELDPASATRLHPNDSTRIARALEVVLSTGRSIAEWQARTTGGLRDQVTAFGFVYAQPPVDWLYPRCDRRFAEMIDQGAVAEVEQLLSRGLSPSLPVMRAIGVAEIARLLTGERDKQQTIAAGAQATRNYAKRQRTWFRHQPLVDGPDLTGPLEGAAAAELLDQMTQVARSVGC